MMGLLTLVFATGAFAEEIRLFDGSTLDGWEGDPQFWKVEDGAIVGRTKGLNYNTFLVNKRDFANFELRFKVKLDANNSGVQFRSEVVDPQKFVMAGYQADIAPGYWGLLYEEKKRGMLDFKMDTKKLAKLGEWVDFTLRAEGPNITITCNGTPTVKYVEKDAAKGAKTGKIGLQLHAGRPMTVAFKDIVLTPLE